MREKKTETFDDTVKLKPILGIRPGVYLTVIYSIILLFILFLLLLRPGLKNPGAMVVVKTEPVGAAIRVDGTYMGTANNARGSKIFVSKGSRTIEAVLPGFAPESAVHEIPSRVFGSLFFPRRYIVQFTLKSHDPVAAFAQAAGEFAAWSFGGEPTATWQIPLVLSEGAYRIGSREQGVGGSSKYEEILPAAARFAVTRAALRDLIRAKILLDNGGNAPSPSALVGSLSDIPVFLSENRGSALWLAELLPPESARIVRESAWYKNQLAVFGQMSKHSPIIPIAATGSFTRRFELAGLLFEGNENFLISEKPVPISLFETFLTNHPQWRDQYTNYFEEEISSGLPETDYITGITWYAAEAFCNWLTQLLPASMDKYEVRLPREEEWVFAYNFGIILNNQGWEWSADPFAPLDFPADYSAIQAVGSPERTIYSGESYNPLFNTSSPKPLIKASLPPDMSSPIVTFRPVIAERE